MGTPSSVCVTWVLLLATVSVCVAISHNLTGVNVYHQYLLKGCKCPSKIVTGKSLNI